MCNALCLCFELQIQTYLIHVRISKSNIFIIASLPSIWIETEVTERRSISHPKFHWGFNSCFRELAPSSSLDGFGFPSNDWLPGSTYLLDAGHHNHLKTRVIFWNNIHVKFKSACIMMMMMMMMIILRSSSVRSGGEIQSDRPIYHGKLKVVVDGDDDHDDMVLMLKIIRIVKSWRQSWEFPHFPNFYKSCSCHVLRPTALNMAQPPLW